MKAAGDKAKGPVTQSPYAGRMVVCQTRFAGSKIYAQFCMKRCRRCELWVKVKKPVAPFVIDGLPQGELEME